MTEYGPNLIPSQELISAINHALNNGARITWLENDAKLPHGILSRIRKQLPTTERSLKAIAAALKVEHYADDSYLLKKSILRSPDEFFASMLPLREIPSSYHDVIMAFLSREKFAATNDVLRLELAAQASRLRIAGDLKGAALCQFAASKFAHYPTERIEHMLDSCANARYVSLEWRHNLSDDLLECLLQPTRLPQRIQIRVLLELGNILMDSDFDKHKKYAKELYEAAHKRVTAMLDVYSQLDDPHQIKMQECRILIRKGYIEIRDNIEQAISYLENSSEVLKDLNPGEAPFALWIPLIFVKYCQTLNCRFVLEDLLANKRYLEEGTIASKKTVSLLFSDFARLSNKVLPDEVQDLIRKNIAADIRIQPGGMLGCTSLRDTFAHTVPYYPILSYKQVKTIVDHHCLCNTSKWPKT